MCYHWKARWSVVVEAGKEDGSRSQTWLSEGWSSESRLDRSLILSRTQTSLRLLCSAAVQLHHVGIFHHEPAALGERSVIGQS